MGSARKQGIYMDVWRRLTPRERQVSRLRDEGMTIIQIMERCNIKWRTLWTHRVNAYRKFVMLGGIDNYETRRDRC